ncbi:hypothetical protein Srufu_025680 [Streptomyces libani subsp. rufus]|nr:hypothetical protein Srufu_025680 [Streptomyces libani subsp. rufus]
MVDTAAVEAGGAAVEAEAEPEPGGGEGVDHVPGEQRPVGLHPECGGAAGGQRGADRGGLGQQRSGAGEQRLAAVQIDPDLAQPVGAGVFGDPQGGLPHGGGRDGRRARAPAAVRAGVDVAVGAGEVAAAVDLEYELPEGHDSGRAGLLPATGRPLLSSACVEVRARQFRPVAWYMAPPSGEEPDSPSNWPVSLHVCPKTTVLDCQCKTFSGPSS